MKFQGQRKRLCKYLIKWNRFDTNCPLLRRGFQREKEGKEGEGEEKGKGRLGERGRKEEETSFSGSDNSTINDVIIKAAILVR